MSAQQNNVTVLETGQKQQITASLKKTHQTAPQIHPELLTPQLLTGRHINHVGWSVNISFCSITLLYLCAVVALS